MSKKILGILFALFFVVAIMGLFSFLLGFLDNPEAVRLSPSIESNGYPEPHNAPAESYPSYLETFIAFVKGDLDKS